MSVEFTGITLRRRGHALKTLPGHVALHANGDVEYCGAVAEHAPAIAELLDQTALMEPLRDISTERATAPSCATCPLVGRATPSCACLQLDGWRIGDGAVQATLRLRPGLPAAVAGLVDETARGRVRRELATFAAGRSMGHSRAA